ncbi:MAG: cytochrome c oxidase subunit 3 [Salegentibacter sp.]
MGLTDGTDLEKQERSKKMMLLFGIVSMVMTFAGLTSAYVVSKSRKDWLSNFDFPSAFFWSTLVIILSSVTFYLAKRNILSGNRRNATALLVGTLVLSALFVTLQFYGFYQIYDQGYYFTGAASSVTTSLIYVLVLVHLVHLIAGIIVLLVVIYNHFKQRYFKGQMLGLELGATFWHFVDILWICLFLFLYFVR